jgi:hypothetical protein
MPNSSAALVDGAPEDDAVQHARAEYHIPEAHYAQKYARNINDQMQSAQHNAVDEQPVSQLTPPV